MIQRVGSDAKALCLLERTFAWLNRFRRLRIRYEKRSAIHKAFLSLGCALICWRHFPVRVTAS